MREDVDKLKGTMNKVLEALQAIASKMDKEDQPIAHVETALPLSFIVEPQTIQGESIEFLIFGLPSNFTPPFFNANSSGPVVQKVQISITTEVIHIGY